MIQLEQIKNYFPAELRDNERLKAFRRNIHFPELLFSLGLHISCWQAGYSQPRRTKISHSRNT
jgi:hypothetical protein